MLDDVNGPGLPRPKLLLHVFGAREDELARGLVAAEAVLYRDGDIDLVAAMAANTARDFIMFDDKGEPINHIGDDEHRLAKLWENALGAALDACCADWDKPPVRGFWLSIDADTDTIRPYYSEPPIATFKLKSE
jgi:hypothetical protein